MSTDHHAQSPEVTVARIPLVEAGDDPIQAELGEAALDVRFTGILAFMRERADTAYLLTWQGSTRVPRGAELGSRVVTWTQHGVVRSEEGDFGVYQRIRDVDGPDRDNEMLVFAFPEPEQ